MSAFGCPAPSFDLYFAAVDRQTGVVAAVGESAPGVLADASEKTGLPKGLFRASTNQPRGVEAVFGILSLGPIFLSRIFEV